MISACTSSTDFDESICRRTGQWLEGRCAGRTHVDDLALLAVVVDHGHRGRDERFCVHLASGARKRERETGRTEALLDALNVVVVAAGGLAALEQALDELVLGADEEEDHARETDLS